jgi:hypothetical protein
MRIRALITTIAAVGVLGGVPATTGATTSKKHKVTCTKARARKHKCKRHVTKTPVRQPSAVY